MPQSSFSFKIHLHMRRLKKESAPHIDIFEARPAVFWMELAPKDRHWNRPVRAQPAKLTVVPSHPRNPQDARMFAACVRSVSKRQEHSRCAAHFNESGKNCAEGRACSEPLFIATSTASKVKDLSFGKTARCFTKSSLLIFERFETKARKHATQHSIGR